MSAPLAALALGIAISQWQLRLSSLAACAAAVAALALLVSGLALLLHPAAQPGFNRSSRYAAVALCLAAALGGYGWGTASAERRLRAALQTQDIDRDLQAEAWVADLPQLGSGGTRLLLEPDAGAQARGLPPRISVLLPLRLSAGAPVRGGDCRRFTLRLRPVHMALNFSGFDAEAWMWGSGIRATGRVRALAPCAAPGWRWDAALQRLRDALRQHLRDAVGTRPAAAILVALAVGDQGGITPEQWTLLWRAGVGHLISISGVHVTLLASILRALAERLWRCSPRACRCCPAPLAAAVVGFLAALAYALLAGFAIPTRRTLFMLAATWLLTTRGLLPGAGRVFWVAVATTLCCDPFAALAPSFWLSFGAVGGLILGDLGRYGARAPWRSEVAAQWVATLSLLPMIALWFGQISVVAPLANALAIPLVSLVITPLSLAALFPGFGWLASPAATLMEVLLQVLGWLCAPAWAALDVPQPPLWSVVLSAAAVLALLLPESLLPGRSWALAGLLPLLIPATAAPPDGQARIEVIDVGQGLAVLVRTRHHSLLFDSGPRWPGGDTGARTIVPLLRAAGIARVDRMVLSHPDADHIGGADSIAHAVPVMDLLASFAWRGAHACERGQQWRWDGVDFAVLYPATTDQPDQPDRADAADRADGADPGDPAAHAVGTRSWSAQPHDRNNHACVLRISAGAHAVLLPADIEAPAERDLVRLSAQSAQLRSELVVVPHHGSRTSSTEAFIAAIGARWAVISLGWHNHYHHPDAAAVGRWAAAGASVVRTDQRGAVRITLAVAGISVEDARTARPAYWRDQTQF